VKGRGGYADVEHEGFGEGFAALEARSVDSWTEDWNALAPKGVRDTCHEGRFWPHYRQVCRYLFGQGHDILTLCGVYLVQVSDLGDAAVAGRGVDFIEYFRAGEGPCDGVFSRAPSQYEGFHDFTSFKLLSGGLN
jgi:hypothetical protein